ncbi:putative cGMP-specific 3 [Penaeus vannamei]|uniref:Phosphodiesterase n=1 Tax=Penaeus vannamei TaxID=6689 RepID=A0A3R7QC92_PENVA|nr:putative cGMP-specific 3 [Penaeus vannamei]
MMGRGRRVRYGDEDGEESEVFRRYLTFCGIGIQNAQLYDMSVREYKRNQLLLQLARGIFEEQTSLDRLVTKIMTEARELLKCERCSVFLLDPQMKNNTKGGSSLPNPGSPEPEEENGEALVIRQSHPPPPDELMRIPVETLTVHMAFELQSRNGECRVTQPSGDQASSSFHARLANYVFFSFIICLNIDAFSPLSSFSSSSSSCSTSLRPGFLPDSFLPLFTLFPSSLFPLFFTFPPYFLTLLHSPTLSLSFISLPRLSHSSLFPYLSHLFLPPLPLSLSSTTPLPSMLYPIFSPLPLPLSPHTHYPVPLLPYPLPSPTRISSPPYSPYPPTSYPHLLQLPTPPSPPFNPLPFMPLPTPPFNPIPSPPLTPPPPSLQLPPHSPFNPIPSPPILLPHQLPPTPYFKPIPSPPSSHQLPPHSPLPPSTPFPLLPSFPPPILFILPPPILPINSSPLQTVNINNVVEWLGSPLEDSGMVTHSVLTIPIFNSSKKILGVAQLINKENGLHFSEHDINTFEAFAIFCGLGIQNTQVYEKACRLMARQQVALECLSYHATASQEDTDKLRTVEIPSAADFDLYNFDFCDTFLTDDETLKCAIRMFVDLDLLNTFHISYEVICRWLLSVKKNYRPVKYHNWRHALTVCQTMFAMLKTGKMEQFMTDLEMLGLLVACLCHDLDHRGTNNSFQTKTDSPLAILYSTSTMEHHHFDQCVMILSQDSNNIFQEYRKVMTVVENAILSTDMAMYFKKKDDFLEMSDNGEFDWQSEEKKQREIRLLLPPLPSHPTLPPLTLPPPTHPSPPPPNSPPPHPLPPYLPTHHHHLHPPMTTSPPTLPPTHLPTPSPPSHHLTTSPPTSPTPPITTSPTHPPHLPPPPSPPHHPPPHPPITTLPPHPQSPPPPPTTHTTSPPHPLPPTLHPTSSLPPTITTHSPYPPTSPTHPPHHHHPPSHLHTPSIPVLCGMMMTACDVSAIAKPWEIQHKTAKLVADEFFEQGDLERLKLNEQPILVS